VAAPASKKKRSYKEQRELDELPRRIAALEAEQTAIRAELADGTLYARDGERAISLQTRDVQIDEELMHSLERWEALG
jgi:ATP-binding cassette subfamily F protein uup